MQSIDLYLKVEADLDDSEDAKKFAREIVRMIEKIYGVRRVEISNVVTHEPI